MAANCRICNDQGSQSQSETYVACNNCGSFACARHYVWWGTSRNAFCTECFPDEAGNTVGGAAGAIDAILQDPGAAGNEELLVNLNGIAREFRDLSLQDLVQLLNMIARELKRRGRG